MDRLISLILFAVALSASAQQYGPVPPRPDHFPGATLVQAPLQHFRQRFVAPRVPEAFQQVEHLQPNRARRPQIIRKVNPLVPQHQQILGEPKAALIEDVPVPVQFSNAVSTPLPQFQPVTNRALTPRPVQEEVNEEDTTRTTLPITPSTTTFTTSLRSSFPSTPAPVPFPQAQVPVGFQKTQFLTPSGFRPSPFQSVNTVPVSVPVPVSVGLTDISLQGRPIVRQQIRPVQPTQFSPTRPPSLPSAATSSPSPSPLAQALPGSSQHLQEENYFRPIQGRPLKKQEPVRQQIIERPQYRQYPSKQTEVVRQQAVNPQEYSKPTPRQPHAKTQTREKKPVAQTIRKYHEEHEDGSITWGYENDDGSFKEETIGVDCVTRGKYGYYDPDGVKREYTYQTGIPCVKTEESEEAESNLHGYIDYTNNKYVFPNGDEIDLEAMVKNRARKPVSQRRIKS